ncbi:MAG: hypothetical protein JRN52_07660 [Nitrososphaerota archaeon]|nr:hypothetical protein [Nitrososphaerota archaeon]
MSQEKNDGFGAIVQEGNPLYKSCFVYFHIINKFLGSKGTKCHLFITLGDGRSFELMVLSPAFGNEHTYRSWGSTNGTPMPLEMQSPKHFIHRRNFDGGISNELTKELKYLGFISVEGYELIGIGVPNQWVHKKISEEFTISLRFESESEYGKIVSTKPRLYKVRFESWDKPILTEISKMS